MGEPGIVVVLTALEVELAALRRHLSAPRALSPHPTGTRYEGGTIHGDGWAWDVVLAEIGPGNVEAAVQCERAIAHFHPQLALFFGIAGSLRPGSVRIGDVVIARKVAAVHGGRDAQELASRPTTFQCAHRIVQLASELRRQQPPGWLARLDPRPEPPPQVHVRPIAAGEVVVASRRSATWAWIDRQFNDAVAVEMEGAGMLQAAHDNDGLAAGVIRGISDVLDDKERSDAAGGQELAARNAAAFTAELLARLDPADLPRSGRPPPDGPGPAPRDQPTEAAAPREDRAGQYQAERQVNFGGPTTVHDGIHLGDSYRGPSQDEERWHGRPSR